MWGLDFTRDVFHTRIPELGINYDQKIMEQAPLVWDRIDYVICNQRDVAMDQVIEGAYLLPKYLADCREFFGDKAPHVLAGLCLCRPA